MHFRGRSRGGAGAEPGAEPGRSRGRSRGGAGGGAGAEPGAEPGRSRGRSRGAAVQALALRMQDVLGSSHALRRDKGALMVQVRQLLCEEAGLLSQARPPACPVAFPETLRVCEGCCSLPWTIWATWEVPELVTPPGTPTES